MIIFDSFCHFWIFLAYSICWKFAGFNPPVTQEQQRWRLQHLQSRPVTADQRPGERTCRARTADETRHAACGACEGACVEDPKFGVLG